MTAAGKPPTSSARTLHPAALTASDPVGLPMVDERGEAHTRRFVLGTLHRGPRHGQVGIEAAIYGAIAADEVEDLCAELLAMRDAAIAEQYREDLETDRAREVHRLALRHSAAALDAALDDPDSFDVSDRELIADALNLRADYAAAGVRLGRWIVTSLIARLHDEHLDAEQAAGDERDRWPEGLPTEPPADADEENR